MGSNKKEKALKRGPGAMERCSTCNLTERLSLRSSGLGFQDPESLGLALQLCKAVWRVAWGYHNLIEHAGLIVTWTSELSEQSC